MITYKVPGSFTITATEGSTSQLGDGSTPTTPRVLTGLATIHSCRVP